MGTFGNSQSYIVSLQKNRPPSLITSHGKDLNMKHFYSSLSILISLLLLSSHANADVIMQTGFEEQPRETPMTRDLWTSEGFQPASWDNGLQSRTKIDDSIAAQGIHSMRVMYPKGEFGTAHTGCQISLLFPSLNEAYASYYLRFSENFSWGTTNYGGKLPGLAGGENCSGGKHCDGTNGWSARLMWRSGGKLILYLYDMLKPDTYGLDVQLTHLDGSPIIAERGKWYHIAERVKMNSTPDLADGEVQIWVNGEEALLLTERKFTTNEVKIDNFYISTFHGGADEGWCPTDTCYTYFDNIKIGTNYEDVALQSCPKPNAGPDQALCATGKATFKVNMTPDYSIQWVKDGERISEGNDFTTSMPGQYIVVADNGHCSQNDTVIVSENIKLRLQKSEHICSTSFVTLNTQQTNDGSISFLWKRNGKAIDGNDLPTLSVKDAGIYTVSASAKNCPTTTDSAIVTSGLLPIEDVRGEEGQTIELSVATEGAFCWRNAKGDLLGNGNRQEITLAAGENYIFVNDENGFNGNVGKKQLTENAWTRNNFDKEFMQFVVERELSIDSLSIYPTKELDATLHIVNEEDGTVVFSQTYNGLKGGTEARLPIGAKLKAGHYHIDAQGTTATLYHSHTDNDIQFPYTIDGLISLTGCNLAWINNKGWYMLFYNWHVSAGNYCAATPVKTTGYNINKTSDTSTDKLSIYQSGHMLIIEGTKTGQSISITDKLGREVTSRLSNGEKIMIDMEHWSNGVYVVEGRQILLNKQ